MTTGPAVPRPGDLRERLQPALHTETPWTCAASGRHAAQQIRRTARPLASRLQRPLVRSAPQPYGAQVAYDDDLADRVRGVLAGERVTEKAMFGGLAFLTGGAMAVAVSGTGGLMVRVDPAEADALLRQPGVEQVQMGARSPMKGWVRVGPEGLADDEALAEWVRRGVAQAGAGPARG